MRRYAFNGLPMVLDSRARVRCASSATERARKRSEVRDARRRAVGGALDAKDLEVVLHCLRDVSNRKTREAECLTGSGRVNTVSATGDAQLDAVIMQRRGDRDDKGSPTVGVREGVGHPSIEHDVERSQPRKVGDEVAVLPP